MTFSNREAFLALVNCICKRPGMYVGSEDLRDVAIYLDGFEHGLTQSLGGGLFTKTWPRWLEGHYVHCHQAQRWTQVLRNLTGSDEAVFAVLPSLYSEFFADLDAIGEVGIEARTSQRIVASHVERNAAT